MPPKPLPKSVKKSGSGSVKKTGSTSRTPKFVPFQTATNILSLQEKYFNAVFTRNIPEINKCLEKGVNPNALSSQTNVAPLHILAERNDYVLGYRLMTASDQIDLDVTTNHGYTALHIAALANSKKFAVLLLEMGANPNAKNKLDRTPLHLGVLRRSYPIIFNLIKYNANANVLDCFENTPLSLSLVQVPNLMIATFLCSHTDLSTEDNKSSLHVFFECVLICHTIDYIDFIALLLDNGININMIDKHSGRMCLHFVAISGFLELAVYLVERGADLTSIDYLSRTPLKVAVEHENFAVADYFQKGYRPPNLLTALPTVKKFMSQMKKRVAERKAESIPE